MIFCIFCLDGYKRKGENKKEIFYRNTGREKEMQKNWKSKLKQLLFAIMFLLVLSGNGNVIPVQASLK